jgi:hypothetical protein
MQTVRFEQVLERCSKTCGILPDTEDYTAEFAERLAHWISTRLPDAWFYAAWRKILKTEQRTYAAPWSSTETYDDGDVIYYEGEYWESLAGSNTNNTPAEGVWWTAAGDVDQNILFDQDWTTEVIAGVKRITLRDPRKTRTPFEYEFITDETGIWLTGNASAEPYVQFWPECPTFTTTEWAAGEAYVEGDLVLGSDGNCYQATEGSTGNDPVAGTSWSAVGFPAFLQRWIEQAVRADFLRYDNQDDKAAAQEAVADQILQRIAMEEGAMQDQEETGMRMRGYGG